MKIYITASLLRRRLDKLDRQGRLTLLGLLFPDMPSGQLSLLADHYDETRVNGSALTLPASWEKMK